MESTNDVAREVVELIIGLLRSESNLTWSCETAENVWRLSPAGSKTPEGSRQYRLRMAPFEDPGTSKPFEICISSYDLPDGFLTHVAHALYQEFRLLTNRVPEEPAGESTPEAHEKDELTDRSEDIERCGETDLREDAVGPRYTETPEDSQGLKAKSPDAREGLVESSATGGRSVAA